MTKTILVTDFAEITNIKVSCKNCNYAVNLPCKSLSESTVKVCPSCGTKFPLSDKLIEGFFDSLRVLLYSLKDNSKFQNIKFEIETEEEKQNT